MLWPVLQEDNYQQTRLIVQKMAHEAGEWAGIPTPIDGESFVVESRHRLVGMMEDDIADPDVVPINHWRYKGGRQTVYVWKTATSKARVSLVSDGSVLSKEFKTATCVVGWSLRAEYVAMNFLHRLLTPTEMKSYIMTGMFIEKSAKSGMYYLFRRLRPTVACRPTLDGNDIRIVSALCLHPVGYYRGTWAGALCPTDDVIAHLLYMRGDEHGYWKHANQIPPEAPEAGIL